MLPKDKKYITTTKYLPHLSAYNRSVVFCISHKWSGHSIYNCRVYRKLWAHWFSERINKNILQLLDSYKKIRSIVYLTDQNQSLADLRSIKINWNSLQLPLTVQVFQYFSQLKKNMNPVNGSKQTKAALTPKCVESP